MRSNRIASTFHSTVREILEDHKMILKKYVFFQIRKHMQKQNDYYIVGFFEYVKAFVFPPSGEACCDPWEVSF